jgi:hypothetical protein
MSMNEDQTAPAWRRVAFLSACAVLALVLPFVLVTRLMGPGGPSSPTGAGTTSSGGSAAGGSAARAASSSTGAKGSSVSPAAAASQASSGSSASPAASSSSSSSQGTSAFDAVVDSCRLANLRQQADLAAAAVSLEQFQKHIDAMNLLVSGQISLAVARTFWDQTRVMASQNAAAFRAADELLAATHSTCPEPGPTAACSAPVDKVEAVTACAKAGLARGAVLARARDSITTWEHHIHDMELLRTGQISPAQATSKWQDNWQTGQRQVDQYAAMLLVADTLRCPLN